jgi:predicted small secreted protein
MKPLRKGITMLKVMSFIVLSALSMFLTACNTVEGAGKDVSHAGAEVSEEAREHK